MRLSFYFIFIALFVLTMAGASILIQNKSLNDQLLAEITNAEERFSNLENQDAKALSTALEVFAQDERFKEVFLKKDREGLYKFGQGLFQHLKDKYGITHTYFILVDGHVFVRLHNHEIYGDKVTRVTFERAQRDKTLSAGIELGQTAYALRVVVPYYDKDELIGYVEYGEEIDHFLEILEGKSANTFVIFVEKKYLDRKSWASVEKVAGELDNWEDYENYVMVSNTKQEHLERSAECFTEENIEQIDRARVIKIIDDAPDDGEKRHRFVCGGFPIIDASGKPSGVVLTLIDATEKVSTAQKNKNTISIIAALLVTLALGLGLFISKKITTPLNKLTEYTRIIGRGDLDHTINIEAKGEIGQLAQAFTQMIGNLKKITASRDEVLKEVSERQKAETALQSANASLLEINEELSDSNESQARVNEEMEKEISLRREAEKKMSSLNEELAKKVDELKSSRLAAMNLGQDIEEARRAQESLNLSLERSNEDLQFFAYIASHDLQEPLRMISSYLQLLERRYKEKLDQDAKEFIAFAVDGATRMQGMINDLLTFSRVTTHGKEFGIVESEEILDKVLLNLKLVIEESGAEIIRGELPRLNADVSQLSQVFQNLIANAIKFRQDEAPVIRISAQVQDDHWLFSVADNGMGFEQKNAEHIFKMFQRLHGRNEIQGSGIGLAVTQKIIERHGGRIWAESEPGKGAVFSFTMPKVNKPHAYE